MSPNPPISAAGAPAAADAGGRREGWTSWAPVALAIVALVAAAIVVIARKSIWADEAFTMTRTAGTLAESYHHAIVTSRKPPLYFLLVHFWRGINPSLESVRVMSAVAMVLMVWCLDRVSRHLGIGRGIFSVAVLAAVTAHFVWAATEARPYAVTLFFLAAALACFTRVWVVGSDRPRRDMVFFVLACYGALQSFHYAGFVLAGLFLGGMVLPARRQIIGAGVVLAGLMLPWLPIIKRQAASQTSYLPPVALASDSFVGTVANTASWVAMTVADIVHRQVPLYNSPARASLYLLLLLGIVGLRLWQSRGRLTRIEIVCLVYAAVGLCAMVTMRLLNKTMVDTRHLVITALPVLVTASLLASRIQPVIVARGAQLALLLASLGGYYSFVRNYQGSSDWRGAIRWVMANERAGEPVMSFNYNPQSIEYYYNGPNPIARIPVDQSTRLDGGRRMVLNEAEMGRLRQFLAGSSGPEHTFWLLEAQAALIGPEVVSAHLGQEIQVLERREYLGVRAYHLRLTQPVTAP